MNTINASEKSLSVIEQYENLRIDNKTIHVPYFNNKKRGKRMSLRVNSGKGSPLDIIEEIRALGMKAHLPIETMDNEQIKSLLISNDIGIDCSGFAYYFLDQESRARGKGGLDKHMHFPYQKGLLGYFRAKFRPIENSDVSTFAHEKNSHEIAIIEAKPGDIITMESKNESERNHILIIYQIDYQNFMPAVLHYAHSIAWPTDGQSGGVRRGTISIVSLDKPITESAWRENGVENEQNYTHQRAKNSQTTLRRLNFF